MTLPDRVLRLWAQNGGVEPFTPENVQPASIDLTIGDDWVSLTTGLRFKSEQLTLIPGEAYLATTTEYVRMPPDCSGVLYLRSSMARAGLDHALAGYVDPGFEGQLTLELHAHRTITLTAGQRVVQLVLTRLESLPEKTYSGRYQGQKGATTA
jgi:dCTP deaminase